jgi:hypothetical protein
VAAVGALAGGALGSQLGGQVGYGAALRAEDRYKAKLAKSSESARHGSRVSKGASTTTGMSRDEELKQIKRKKRTAAVNSLTSAVGIGSLAALGAAGLPNVPGKVRGQLARGAAGATVVSGGVSSLNGLAGARQARRDLRAREHALSKALGIRRAPAMRRGYLRQTRNGAGIIRTTSVRGGLA